MFGENIRSDSERIKLPVSWDRYPLKSTDALCFTASVHGGRLARAMAQVASLHQDQLTNRFTARRGDGLKLPTIVPDHVVIVDQKLACDQCHHD